MDGKRRTESDGRFFDSLEDKALRAGSYLNLAFLVHTRLWCGSSQKKCRPLNFL